MDKGSMATSCGDVFSFDDALDDSLDDTRHLVFHGGKNLLEVQRKLMERSRHQQTHPSQGISPEFYTDIRTCTSK